MSDGDSEKRTVRESEALTVREGGSPVDVPTGAEPAGALQQFRGYRIIEELPASGGESDIYVIEKAGEKRVLKLYRYGIAPKEEIFGAVQEISNKYPDHFVRIYEYGYEDLLKRWFEIQEYISYSTLQEMVPTLVSGDTLKTIVREIANALHILHTHNILHLDLKPSNVLVREKEPLDLVFTDFGVSSVIRSDMTRKMTTIKGTPHYWSPEAITGVVGKEADYWSLGMIVLEMLYGKHPFSGIDMKVIMYTLSTRGVTIEQDVPDEFRLLLSGLLTREPHRRWGDDEVGRWLKGERNIPVYFAERVTGESRYEKPVSVGGNVMFSIEEFASSMPEDMKGWKEARDFVTNGYLGKWAEENSDYKNSVQLAKMIETSFDDVDLALIRVLYSFHAHDQFVLYGKVVSVQNLILFVTRFLAKKSTQEEDAIIDDLVSGNLVKYYGEYLFSRGKEPDGTYRVLEAADMIIEHRYDYIIEMYHSEVAGVARFLDIIINPGAYVLPDSVVNDPLEHAGFIAGFAKVIPLREKLDEYLAENELPAAVRDVLDDPHNRGIEEFERAFGDMKTMSDEGLLLHAKQWEEVRDRYVLPRTIVAGIEGEEAESYCSAVRDVRTLETGGLLIAKKDFERYRGKNRKRFKYSLSDGVLVNDKESRDADMKEYMDMARLVKYDVIIHLMGILRKIRKSLDRQEMRSPSSSMAAFKMYLDALASPSVRWSAEDPRIIKELYTTICGKDASPSEVFRRPGSPFRRTMLRALQWMINRDFEEGTEQSLRIFQGGVAGLIAAVPVALSVLAFQLVGFGLPFLCGILFGVMRRSVPTMIAGAIGALILYPHEWQRVTVYSLSLDFVYIAAVLVTAGALLGYTHGGRRRLRSVADRIFDKFRFRFAQVEAEMERVNHGQ